MIIRRMADGIRTQNWFTVIVEIFIVVIGIFLGLQVSEWNEDRAQAERTKQVIQTLREDLQQSPDYEAGFVVQVKKGIDAWHAAFKRGERPPPYYFRVPGSDTPPSNVWSALLNMRLGELVHPKLVFELAFYYSEINGVGRKHTRHAAFIEDKILPNLKEGSSVFYTDGGARLKPEFEVYMQNLQLWANEMAVNVTWARCLASKLEELAVTGESCVPALGFDDSEQAVFKNEAAQ